MNSKLILGVVAIAATIIIVYAVYSGSLLLGKAIGEKQANWNTSKPARPDLPEFAQKTTRVEEAYIFAVQNQDKLKYLACYCGCAGMQHSDVLISHKSLKECYIKPNGEFESHASECKLCNDITLEARDMLMKGYSLKEVRKTIDEEYSGMGVGTNTSLPP